MSLTDRQQEDLDYLMDSYDSNYPERFIKGSLKYNSLLSEKSAYQNALDTREELWDGIAYINFNLQKLDQARLRLELLKDRLQSWVDIAIEFNSPISELENLYDPIRRIDSIMEILYG